MKKTLKYLLFLAILLMPSAALCLEEKTDIVLFYTEECPFCEKMTLFLESIEDERIEIHYLEINKNIENREKFYKIATAYNQKISGVPVLFIGDLVFVGYSESFKEKISEKIDLCKESSCASPFEALESGALQESSMQIAKPESTGPSKIIIIAVVFLGIVSILMLLMLLIAKRKIKQQEPEL